MKKKNIEVKKGRLYVSASFNNTMVTFTDMEGRTLIWGSSGSSGFKGTKKATPYAATTVVDRVLSKAKEDYNLKELEVYIKGPGVGRDAALRAIRASALRVSLIADVTPLPHNGPRPKKKRKV